MKQKTIIIIGGILFVFSFSLGLLVSRPEASGAVNPNSIEKSMVGMEFKQEVRDIRDKLYVKTQEYREKEAQKQDLEKKIVTLTEELRQLAESAAAYDAVLCKEHDVRWVRPTPALGLGSLRFGCADF